MPTISNGLCSLFDSHLKGYIAVGRSNVVRTIAELCQYGGAVAGQRRETCEENETGRIDSTHWRHEFAGATITRATTTANSTIPEHAAIDEPTAESIDDAATKSAKSNATAKPTKQFDANATNAGKNAIDLSSRHFVLECLTNLNFALTTISLTESGVVEHAAAATTAVDESNDSTGASNGDQWHVDDASKQQHDAQYGRQFGDKCDECGRKQQYTTTGNE